MSYLSSFSIIDEAEQRTEMAFDLQPRAGVTVVDFSQFNDGDKLYLVNLLSHKDGQITHVPVPLDETESKWLAEHPQVGISGW